jgi:hypothetical protein
VLTSVDHTIARMGAEVVTQRQNDCKKIGCYAIIASIS